ncbi:MAG TPA: flagellar basal-body rod protein FlgG [Phycisphaerae bacterium]|nr:flagellar basal-body rod protein FlgG [Phycisphaerae bacterium]HRR87213.1 flagellar basal-body rod protein FlgG [Phycisphaerae bacterium]
MGITAMYAAATGMKAMDTKLNVVANNLANVGTVGFKRSRTNFEDLMYQTLREPGVKDINDEPNPYGILVGLGAAVSGTQLDFRVGSAEQTDKPLDVMIQGEGFFQVTTYYNGEEIRAYTRAGNFFRNANGQLVLGNTDGSVLEPRITLGEDDREIEIDAAGRVSAIQGAGPDRTDIGQIELARFINPEGLKSIGQNLYVETDASGPPITGNPMENGMGSLQNRMLELSNVEPVRELVDLIFTQRGFELNSQSIQGADEMLRVVANLRR